MGDGNTKIVLLGDKEQCDRKGLRDSSDCGLVHAKERLKDVEGVAIDEFNNNDIVRNTFITKIFEKWKGKTVNIVLLYYLWNLWENLFMMSSLIEN